jgi:hypothetical protein
VSVASEVYDDRVIGDAGFVTSYHKISIGVTIVKTLPDEQSW